MKFSVYLYLLEIWTLRTGLDFSAYSKMIHCFSPMICTIDTRSNNYSHVGLWNYDYYFEFSVIGVTINKVEN